MQKKGENLNSINYSRLKSIAVIGASANTNKWGFKVYMHIKSLGIKVFAVNPHYQRIGMAKCYPSLSHLPEKPEMVITVVPPDVTLEVAKQCKLLGIKKIWMQSGSESNSAVNFCQNNNIKIVANACFIMNSKT